MYRREDFRFNELAVAMTEEVAAQLRRHFDKTHQEDLTFGVWRPSAGSRRMTAIISNLLLPWDDERELRGNVAFTGAYLRRVLTEVPAGAGLVFIHSHLGPGWQAMSGPDIIAERDRIASPASSTQLPLVGLTWGTDGSLSARAWLRVAASVYERFDAVSVRVVGQRLAMTFHPKLKPALTSGDNMVATISVWGSTVQADLSRLRVGVVGLGSVGSIVAEGLARSGITDYVLIDPDRIEVRNFDRTLGATAKDIDIPKVAVAHETILDSATTHPCRVSSIDKSLVSEAGLAAALDCDVLFSCVDRPWPRHLMNAISYAHLIPVIDGGILAVVSDGRLVHADWRVHTVGPGRECLVCGSALELADVGLDMAGKLDDPDYIKGLPEYERERHGRRNIFAFSLGVASHEILHLAGLVAGNRRISGIGPQTYHCYPGEMRVRPTKQCRSGCEYAALAASAADMRGNLEAL